MNWIAPIAAGAMAGAMTAMLIVEIGLLIYLIAGLPAYCRYAKEYEAWSRDYCARSDAYCKRVDAMMGRREAKP